MCRVPNSVDGHDTPELEIFGSDGVPREDLQRHLDNLPPVPYTRSRLIIGDSSILPILAAQKVSVAAQLAESKNMTVQGVVLPSQSYQNVAKPAGVAAVSSTIINTNTNTAAPVTVSSVHNGQSSFSPSLSSSSSSSNVMPPNFYNPYGGYGMMMPGYGPQGGYYPPPPATNQQYMAAAYYQQQQQQQQQLQYAQQYGQYPQYSPPLNPQYPLYTAPLTASATQPHTSTAVKSPTSTPETEHVQQKDS